MNRQTEERRGTTPWKSDMDQNYESFLERLSVKGRATVEKHDELTGGDAAEGFGSLWKRLAGGLGRLATHEIEMVGAQSVKYHIADGKYRLQVFALEDTRKGTISVYLPNIVDRAIEKNILLAGSADRTYKIVGGDDSVQLELITAETRDMTLCKAMVGWGRQALKVNVSVTAKEKHVRTVELLCELAAEAWAAKSA